MKNVSKDPEVWDNMGMESLEPLTKKFTIWKVFLILQAFCYRKTNDGFLEQIPTAWVSNPNA